MPWIRPLSRSKLLTVPVFAALLCWPQPASARKANDTQYPIVVSASPSVGGTVSGAGTFPAGSSRTVAATPSSGYSFVNWTQNGSVMSTSSSYPFTLNGDATLVANFAATGIIPLDRSFAWNPGLMSQGGIPNRVVVCATLSPIGGGMDDSFQINNAIARCPNGQVVNLNAGNFTVNRLILVNKPITLRGAGAGVTVLTKANGAKARTSTVVDGTDGILMPIAPSTYRYDPQPIIIAGPQRWPHNTNGRSMNLTADGAQGSYSVTVAGTSGLAAGQFVLLDELSGASWQPVPSGFGCTNSIDATPCPPMVWRGDRVTWNMHWPQQRYQDDNGNSNASGPYDTAPGVRPASMSWFSRTDRPINEIKEIASISGNTVTFTSPLSITYRADHAAQIATFPASSKDAQVRNIGIENLSAVGGADGGIRFESAAYSWAKNVEVTQWIGEGIAIDQSFHVEVGTPTFTRARGHSRAAPAMP